MRNISIKNSKIMNRAFVVSTAVASIWMAACAFDPNHEENDEPNTEQHQSALFIGSWTAPTSEELPPRTCPTGYAVDAMECTGSDCDNVALHCGQISTASSPDTFLPYISEEAAKPNFIQCGPNRFIVGIACQGSHCDNLSIQCATFANRSRDDSTCAWEAFFSDEQRFGLLPDGYAAAGLQCTGSHCDNMSMFRCRVR